MSHISETTVRFDSKEAIRKMCELLPQQFQFHDRFTFRSYGRDSWECDFAIGVTGASYEVGFQKQKDGTLKPLVDWWQSGGLVGPLGGKDMPVLKQGYSVGKTVLEAERLGHEVRVASMPDGQYKLMVAKQEHARSWKWSGVVKQAFAQAKAVLKGGVS
jgi:hypothetical protein